MSEEFSSATDFTLKKFLIFRPGAQECLDIKKLVVDFEYAESIVNPFVIGSATIVDSAGLIGSLPIKGGERVVVTTMTNATGEPIEYDMILWKVANRFAQQKTQTYTIGLISPEALQNEITRVNTVMEGNPEAIIKKLISEKEYIGSGKEFFSEPSLLETKLIL